MRKLKIIVIVNMAGATGNIFSIECVIFYVDPNSVGSMTFTVSSVKVVAVVAVASTVQKKKNSKNSLY